MTFMHQTTHSKPLVIELFAGRFGWSRGFVAEGWQSVGFDIVHESYHGDVPEGCDLVLQDVLTLHGSQFREASCIVASPPCQRYSYMAMPWSKAKALIKWHKESPERVKDLNALFDACFRIQIEASKAAGHYIPLVVENVRGAQPWVGRANWHHGSYYLWGDVPALMPTIQRGCHALRDVGSSFAESTSNTPMTASALQSKNGTAILTALAAQEGVKQPGLSGRRWFDDGAAHFGSSSPSRKAASAAIAEIPFELASHIARVFHP